MNTKKYLRKELISKIVISSFLILFGVFFALAGSGVLFSSSYSTWIKTTGSIVDITGKIKVTYFVESLKKVIEGISNISGNIFKINDQVTVLYNPLNPYECTIKIPTSFSLIFIIPGIIVSLIGLLILIKSIIKYNKEKNKNILFTDVNDSINIKFDRNKTDNSLPRRNPSFLYEYKEINDKNKLLFRFRVDKNNSYNYIVENKDDKKLFSLNKINENKYKLIDLNKDKTEIIKIDISKINKTNNDFGIKINDLKLSEFFYNRHLTYECKNSKNGLIYYIYNNLELIGEIYEIEYDENTLDSKNERMFIIISNKESIDDISLFASCISKRHHHEIGYIKI